MEGSHNKRESTMTTATSTVPDPATWGPRRYEEDLDPSETDLAVLPADTQPPAWVSVVDFADKPDVDGSRSGEWKTTTIGDSGAGVFVSQWVKYLGDEVRLSEPWIDMEAEVFEMTPKEARALARDLVKAARVLDQAIAETWELLGAAGRA